MSSGILMRCVLAAGARSTMVASQPVRFARHKPWHPKFRIMRQYQPWPQPTDMYALMNQYTKGTTQEIREIMKRDGLLPNIIFIDRPINVSCSPQVFDPYVPPEGDGKASIISKEGVSQQAEVLKEKGQSYRHLRKIRKFESDLQVNEFAMFAEKNYIEAHEMLQNVKDNERRLFELVTEKAFVEMTHGLRLKTFRWKFIESIEPPRVVHIRSQEMMSKDNMYGQVTVRFFTKQILAIYDRFGRLCYGNEAVVRDVLEYVVFERHLSDEFSRWRLHSKVVPDWMPRKSLYRPTMRVPQDTTRDTRPPPQGEDKAAHDAWT